MRFLTWFQKKPKTPYDELGGAKVLQQLVTHFYQVMDTDPRAHECRALHGTDLTGAQEKLFDFLSGWLGGPPLFEQKHGHPRLRMRHFPFAIGERERDQWLLCMREAFARTNVKAELRDKIMHALSELAERVRNQ